MTPEEMQKRIEETLLRNALMLERFEYESANVVRLHDVQVMLKACAANLGMALAYQGEAPPALPSARAEAAYVVAMRVVSLLTRPAPGRALRGDEREAVKLLRKAALAISNAASLLEDEEARNAALVEGSNEGA